MDEYLQKLVQELGEAINSSINDSDAVNDALERIRATGHEVLLVLEATIALKDRTGEREEEPLPFEEVPLEERMKDLSQEDHQFLKSLKIKFDEEE